MKMTAYFTRSSAATLAGWLLCTCLILAWLDAQAQTRDFTLHDRTNLWLVSSNILRSNILAGSGITIAVGAKGQLTVSASGGGTNFDSIIVTNRIIFPAVSDYAIEFPDTSVDTWPSIWLGDNGSYLAFTNAAHGLLFGINHEDGAPTFWQPPSFNTITVHSFGINAPTNIANFTITTNNFVLNQYYTNSNQRSWVAANIGMTNILATDKCQVNLYLDQDGDGTWERTGIEARLQGVALMAGAEELSAFIQPNARFLFTNFSTGTATATVDANSSQWVRQ